MARQKPRHPREVFLSHSSQDRKFVRWLRDELRRNGIAVWYSEAHIAGAQQWHDEIGEALERCDWFLLVLSSTSVRSAWVKRELLFALENARYNNHILPVLHRACDIKKLSWTLSSMQHVDFTQDKAEGLATLLRIWGIK